jgi:hypothetical protein
MDISQISNPFDPGGVVSLPSWENNPVEIKRSGRKQNFLSILVVMKKDICQQVIHILEAT